MFGRCPWRASTSGGSDLEYWFYDAKRAKRLKVSTIRNMNTTPAVLARWSILSGAKSPQIVDYGKQILMNLQHRGASGADESTGDGAGILMQIPHEYLRRRGRSP